jgi:hypothetical protein
MGAFKANIYTLTVWALSSLEFWRFRADRKIRVRYEDFLQDPCGSVNRISRHFGLPGTLDSAENLPTGRVFQGNRVRTRDSITIKPQVSERLLHPFWVVLSTLLQLPVLLHYGYLLRAPGRGSSGSPDRQTAS